MKAVVVLAAAACVWGATRLAACGSFAASEPPADASADLLDAATATDAPDASRPRRCEGQVLFEDDFAGPVIRGDWIVVGGPVLDFADGLAAPSLLATTKARTDGDEANQVRHALVPPTPRLCIELDLRVDAAPATYALGAFTEVLTLIPESNDRVFVEVRSTGMVLAVERDASPLAAFSFGRWIHLVLRVDYAAASPLVEVEIDGTRVARQVRAGSVPPSVEAYLGTFTSGAAGAATVHADNFVITAP